MAEYSAQPHRDLRAGGDGANALDAQGGRRGQSPQADRRSCRRGRFGLETMRLRVPRATNLVIEASCVSLMMPRLGRMMVVRAISAVEVIQVQREERDAGRGVRAWTCSRGTAGG